ncbi:ParB/RepB/Spo0J family partition protein [Cohaesibacter intestini]|uniref:ParB/RepB/Spo0J family partition protein n=1 Tax=Cohaesibacter intestini TaxID=2211145 RepID=UPI000DEAB1D9|nr:ParB/RepB/Spo0J family partition protein [Cohaesibacter intestini]
MTGKKQHPLFGTVDPDYIERLKNLAQFQLAGFPLQDPDWQKTAKEALDKLVGDIEAPQKSEIKSENLSAEIKMTQAPVAAFLCKHVKTSNCGNNDPSHWHSCEKAGEKLSSIIFAATLICHGKPKSATAITKALVSARTLKEKDPDLLLLLVPFLDGKAETLYKKLSELHESPHLKVKQVNYFKGMALLIGKAIEVFAPQQHTNDTTGPSKLSNAQKFESVDLDGKVIIIPTSKIDPSPFPHRLEDETHANEIEVLSNSMEKDGQDVPIIVRLHPDDEKRYQVVSGNRRLMAAKEMAEPLIKCIVKDVDDIGIMMVQGREISLRKDASYIERVRLAGHLFKTLSNYTEARARVMDALSIGETEASRLKVISEKIPNDIIESIGRAPKVGRGRWNRFAKSLTQPERLEKTRKILRDKSFSDIASTCERFVHLEKEILANADLDKPINLKVGNTTIGVLAHKKKRSDLQIPNQDFAEFVADKLPELFEAFNKIA